jgi:hypothetical protein
MRVKTFYFFPCLILFFLRPFQGNAQTNSKAALSGDFDSLTLDQFVQELEARTNCHFYYESAPFDSLRITLHIQNEPLESALEKAFAGLPINYSIDPWNRVFFSKGQPVQVALPAGLLNGTGGIKRGPAEKPLPEPDNKLKKGQKTIPDNKLYEIGSRATGTGQSTALLSGYVLDSKTGDPIVGASIYLEKSKVGVTTDQYGFYSISIPKGNQLLNIQSIGMKDSRRMLLVYGDGKMNIELHDQVITLKNVVISAQKLSNVRSTQMGVQKIDIRTIKQVPVVFGEADILRVILTLPGVQSVGESSTGLNVRGGATDQNLILFNDATIYNPAHFFGLFSAFSPEVIKDAELYKSSIPARFGGRLSSVLDISTREGNKKDLSGTAGIGLLTSRLELDGPLIKDKSSFILGARTTYANWLLHLLPEQYNNSRASFYDINLDITHQINKKNTLYLTGYLSQDRFNLNSDTLYGYGNKNISLKWKHVFSDKLYALFTAGIDRYQYDISSNINPVNAYQLSFDINQYYFKAHFNQYLSSRHTLEYGLSSIFYRLDPGDYLPMGSKSLVIPQVIPAERALENAVYLSDKYSISPALSLEAGIRYSNYEYVGPQTINLYPAGIPRTVDNISGTKQYAGGSVIKTYGGPEWRISARYAFSDSFSIKAGYNTQRQYIQMLSNTTAMAPTDIWKLSDSYISPQYGQQYSLGLYKNFKNNTVETSIEVYYKDIQDVLDYKSGAVLVLNPHIETDVFNARGKAYGVEVLIKKTTGKLNGWVSYTYSRTFLKMDDPIAGEVINKGMYYPANYDQPHDANFIGNYRITHRYSFSLNAVYSTGRPITLPIANFYYGGSERTLYGDRNGYRIPDYFRLDLSMNIAGDHKLTQKFHNSWTVGVYNLTGRKNPYSVYFISQNGVVNGYKLSVFGSAIPYVNFNVNF